jgi:large subunit ribosomal protein L1
MMGVISKVAKVLGPRGLLPNKKLGTVTTEIAKTVKDMKTGQAFLEMTKPGLYIFQLERSLSVCPH